MCQMTEAYVSNNSTKDLRQGNYTIKNVIHVNTDTENSADIMHENCNSTKLNSPQLHKQESILQPQNDSKIMELVPEDINLKDCENKSKISNNRVLNKIQNADTVLKYVYKKGDKIVPEKNLGHAGNSVKRKKRNVDDKTISYPPLLLDLNKKLDIIEKEKFTLPQLTPKGIINKANLADFNIETLHGNEKPGNNILFKNNVIYNKDLERNKTIAEARKIENDSIESEEEKQNDKENSRDSDNENRENTKEHTDSSEVDEKNNVRQQYSNESEENGNYQQNKENNNYRGYPENNEEKELKTFVLFNNNGKYSNDLGKSKYFAQGRNIDKENINRDEEKQNNKGNSRYSDDESRENSKEYSDSYEVNEDNRVRKQYPDESENENGYYEQKKERSNTQNLRAFQKNNEAKEFKPNNLKERVENPEKYIPDQEKPSTDDSEESDTYNKYTDEENEFPKQNEESTKRRIPNVEPELSSENYENDKSDEDRLYSSTDRLLGPKKNTNENLNSSDGIQKVDLGDFSYEIIQENAKGHDESSEDIHEKNSDKSNINNNYDNKPYLKQENEHAIKQSTFEDENIDTESNNDSNESQKQVSINDGEVKPVIELNNEDSDEGNDEESKENTKDNLNLNIKQTTDNSFNFDNSQEIESSNQDKSNLKQQFERIPTNYNHAVATSNKNGTSDDDYNESDGTLDTIAPIKDKLDDKSGIKFKDISIKLPEINLPDDILAYADEEPTYEKIKNPREKKKNNNRYDNSNEHTDEDESNNTKNNYEDEVYKKDREDKEDQADYYESYFGKPNEKIQKTSHYYEPNKSEEEDLYEKFVRERFGKSNSLKKRTEKLIDRKANNPELFEKIENVLKKAGKIEKEAEKSGDPEAGYLWTLEYGENL